jgi:hypothetical protein
MDERKMINITPEFLRDFGLAYKAASAEAKESFFFQGNEYHIGYAKYLIEYIEGEAKRLKWPKAK